MTGRGALFVNPGYTDAIVGLQPKESDALLGFLFAHLSSPRFHYRHHWNVDDVVIWDEVATVHQGPDDFWPQRRGAAPHHRRRRRAGAPRRTGHGRQLTSATNQDVGGPHQCARSDGP